MNSAIEVDNPIKYYSHISWAWIMSGLRCVRADLRVFPEPNGAGKMTTRRALTMLLESTPGQHPNQPRSSLRVYPVKQQVELIPEKSNAYSFRKRPSGCKLLPW